MPPAAGRPGKGREAGARADLTAQAANSKAHPALNQPSHHTQASPTRHEPRKSKQEHDSCKHGIGICWYPSRTVSSLLRTRSMRTYTQPKHDIPPGNRDTTRHDTTRHDTASGWEIQENATPSFHLLRIPAARRNGQRGPERCHGSLRGKKRGKKKKKRRRVGVVKYLPQGTKPTGIPTRCRRALRSSVGRIQDRRDA
ncbi:hypothetical protein VTJ83DRAFT_6780 [Remersonia thermophila]|uniref:Uncharacterized protein n=1 Tax=Remersonia thermophila TaxID=72144 RepID=A0ABR4D6I2_9PEZI